MQNKLWRNSLVILTAMLMTSCAGLGEMAERATSSDSFCATYQQVILIKGEGTITAQRSVKNRIATNEKTYLCNCVTPKPAFCDAKTAKKK